MKKKSALRKFIPVVIAAALIVIAYTANRPAPGEIVDEFNGVAVYYNGSMDNDFGRSVTPDGYNLGKKYQCVEFVKRYYLEVYGHRMPDTYGHAKDYFTLRLEDGEFNAPRGLVQYTNPSVSKPRTGDIIVMRGQYGHMGIVSYVTNDAIEMVQQNTRQPRRVMHMSEKNGMWKIDNPRVFGWLRLEK